MSVTKFFDVEIGKAGLTEAEAIRAGHDVRTAFIKARTKPHYYPGARPIWLKGVVDNETNRLLGVQAVGAKIHHDNHQNRNVKLKLDQQSNQKD